MDFRLEAGNIRRFAEAFADSQTVYVPMVVDGLYAESVLVQERSGGRRIDDPSVQARGPLLAQAFVDAYLEQFFLIGVFHGDPHPGNLFVLEDGRICFHDFGLVGFLDQGARRSLAALTQAFIHQDGDWLLDAYLDLGVLGGGLDRAEFRRRLEELIADYARRPFKDWSLAEAFMRIARMGRGQNIRIPHNLLVLMRAVFLMESTVRTLDPNFNLLDGLSSKAEQVLRASAGEQEMGHLTARLRYEALLALDEAPAALGAWLHRLRAEGPELRLRLHGLAELGRGIERASNRMALALVTLGLYIAASLLMQHSLGPRLGGMPVLAAVGYVIALWFTFRLVRGIAGSGRL